MTKRVKKVRIFSALEVANICGVVNRTAINWIKNNHLKAFTTPGGQYRIYSEDLIEFLDKRGMRVPSELTDAVAGSNSNKKVMIIDDDKDLNEMMKLIFSRKLENFDIIQAFDGFEAGKLLVSEKPDAIILDIDLPGVNGHLLCSKIKDDKDLNNPIVISISGLDDSFEEEKILSEGADAFFTKPLDFDKLISAMKDLMGTRVFLMSEAITPYILLVEDEDSVRLTLRDFLKKKGYNILVASDGVSAIKQLLDHEVVMIITDYRMQILGGDYWIKFLERYCEDIKIIITSGFLHPEFSIPFEVMYKPFDYYLLAERIEDYLNTE